MSEDRFRAASEASLDSLVMMEAVRDDTGRIVDFLITAANDNAARLFGVPVAAMVGRQVSAPLPHRLRGGAARASTPTVVETGEPVAAEYPVDASPGARRVAARADRQGRRRHRADVERHHRAEAHRDGAPGDATSGSRRSSCTPSTSCASSTTAAGSGTPAPRWSGCSATPPSGSAGCTRSISCTPTTSSGASSSGGPIGAPARGPVHLRGPGAARRRRVPLDRGQLPGPAGRPADRGLRRALPRRHRPPLRRGGAAAPDAPRRSHRTAQPRAAARPTRPRARPRPAARVRRRGPVPRRRPLQGGQRHHRPRRR